MASKVLVGVSGLVVVMVFFMAFIGADQIAYPRFTVINKSAAPVELTVGWDGHGQPYGNVAPQQRVKFSVDAEAEMTLLAKYPNGTTVASQPVYLGSGTVTKAIIFETHIEFE